MKSLYLFFISTLVFNAYCMEHPHEKGENNHNIEKSMQELKIKSESSKYPQIIREYCTKSLDGLELFDAIDKAISQVERIKLLYGKTSLKLIYSITNLFKDILAEKYATEYSNLSKNELNELLIRYLISLESSSCNNVLGELPELLEIEIAKLIIAGADADLEINYNISPKKLTLFAYIIEKNVETPLSKMLVFYNADFNSDSTMLAKAIAKDNLEMVKLLIDCGVDVTVRNPKTNSTILIDSMIEGSRPMVSLLLSNLLIKENINQTDIHGYTAFDYAIRQVVTTHNFYYMDIIEQLLKNGALINLSPADVAKKYCYCLGQLRDTNYANDFKNIFKNSQVMAIYPQLKVALRLDAENENN